MIRFNVFNKGKPAQTMSLYGTYLFGQDDIPVRSQVDFSTGELLGLRHSDTAVGLSTLWEINSFGKTILQTTRLPERNEPYNLNVEIARGRLLHISQKREEWGLTDPALAENHHELIDESLDKFVDALCNLDQPEKASVLADESLLLSMKAGEQMSMTHAKVFLDRRNTTQKIGQHCFGCCFDPSRIKDSKYLSHIKKNFQFVTVPISWRQIEPKEHERNFDLIDECINWLGRNRIAVQVGPLLSFHHWRSPTGYISGKMISSRSAIWRMNISPL